MGLADELRTTNNQTTPNADVEYQVDFWTKAITCCLEDFLRYVISVSDRHNIDAAVVKLAGGDYDDNDVSFHDVAAYGKHFAFVHDVASSHTFYVVSLPSEDVNMQDVKKGLRNVLDRFDGFSPILSLPNTVAPRVADEVATWAKKEGFRDVSITVHPMVKIFHNSLFSKEEKIGETCWIRVKFNW